MQFTIHKKEELHEVAQAVLAFAERRKIILLEGDLGAGKTALAQAICALLGVREHVVSPTFSIVNEYSYCDEEEQERLVHHLDLYRLKNLQEALDIGIEDYLFDGHFCLIEWPELIAPLLPEAVVRIKIELLPDSNRKILLL